MSDIYADVAPFRNDALSLFMERGDGATEKLVPLALGPDPVFLLTDPDFVKPLLMMSEDMIDKGPLYKVVDEVFGENALTLMGPEQRRRRSVLNKLVTRNAAAPIMPLLAAEMRAAVAQAAKSQSFEAREFGAGLAMRLVCLAAFGPNALSPEDEILLKQTAADVHHSILDKILGATDEASATANERIGHAKENLHRILARVRERVPESIAARAFAELQLSEHGLVDELLALLFAGNDTTGSAFAWLLYVFATMPELACSIAEEAATARNESGEIDLAKLPSARTSVATVQELLRMYPPAAWIPRGTRKDIEFAGRKLTAGSTIIIPQWLFHRSARFWDAPDEFRLDRDYRTSAYIPFGTGPRICVAWSLAELELQLLALETASALQLTLAGPLGPPEPLMINLWPPRIPLEARPRVAIPAAEH